MFTIPTSAALSFGFKLLLPEISQESTLDLGLRHSYLLNLTKWKSHTISLTNPPSTVELYVSYNKPVLLLKNASLSKTSGGANLSLTLPPTLTSRVNQVIVYVFSPPTLLSPITYSILVTQA